MAEIKSNGIPNRQTKGALGDIYTDLDTGLKYKCTGAYAYNTYAESKAEYEWRVIDKQPDKKPSTPSNTNTKVEKVNKVIEPVQPVEPVKEDVQEPVKPIQQPKNNNRRQGKTNGNRSVNYNKYYQQKKTIEK